ncbi:bifunctional sugar-1-phosphate nucleotidylyltransferase/acetyltransferase [Halopenitus sp. POP-27]|uniref:bifunctional sugar-1-phosphate nucleotidylyltransferase/acetyltransferase n=1 Tax=Halopenitus sp. POP-27 TaxID=2994425 RepID=UPI00246880FF|nr:bifunctional sugar-1-phosphate nucleotidylyltransferase/acetyltransferase [Halopenitus sp. POP-27]
MTDDPVTAVVLAAGEGRRLEPLTNRRPKPMLPVANRPILEYVIEAISDAGIDRIVLVVGYRQERIRNHVGDGDDWDVDVEYVEQANQLGTGHALLQAEPAVDDRFVVLNGDRLVDADLVGRVREETRDGKAPVMTVTDVDHPGDYGVVALDDRDRVTGIDEKPEGPVHTSRINAGVYGFTADVFDAIRGTSPAGELALTDTLDRIAGEDPITAIGYRGRWLDVSYLWDLLRVNASLVGAESGADTGSESGVQSGTAFDAESDVQSVSEPDAESAPGVADDVVVGTDVRLGKNAVVGGGSALGENATIGANAVVEGSVVFPDAVIEPGAVVRDAVVAGNARVGANATIAGGRATVIVDDEVHADVTLGGVVGDNATVGGGATLVPGTVLGDASRVDPGAVVSGTIEPDAVVRRG